MNASRRDSASGVTTKHDANTSNIHINKIVSNQNNRICMCVGPAKAVEHLLLPALFFGDFILSLSKDSFVQAKERTLNSYVLAFPVRKIIDAFAL
ncbi:MAG TPA: hypothetical protein VGQ04_03055 [Chitinophagaceae bacterium]|jgi:hypothetical protein|nr:hypothetical protein [Chitinophagaceae bacterium]